MGVTRIEVNYDTGSLVLIYEGVIHLFKLKDGDVGEFWHGFQHKGEELDFNFHINDDGIAFGSVYGTTQDEKTGHYSINTSDETYIGEVKELGDREKYLNWD